MNRRLALAALALLLASCAPKPKPALEVFRWWWAQPFSSSDACGYVRNHTPATFDTVHVVLDLFDAKGAPLGRDTLNLPDIRPGEVGSFDVEILPAHPSRWRLVELSGHASGKRAAAPISPSRIPRPMTPPSARTPADTPAAPAFAPPPSRSPAGSPARR